MSLLVLIIGQRGSGKTYLNDALTTRFHKSAPELPVYAVRTADDLARGRLPRGSKLYSDPKAALDAIYRARACNFLLSVSEAQNIAGNRADYYDPRCRDLIFEGRHMGAHLVLDTQRASSISTDAYSQATDIFSFRQEYPGDLERLAEWTADPRDIEIVRKLNPHEFFAFRTRKVYRLS